MRTLFCGILVLLTIISVSYGAEGKLQFSNANVTSGSATINTSGAVCIYLFRKYQPVTKLAGQYGCNAKAEIALYKATGKRLVKLKKSDLGDIRYRQIENAFLKSR